MGTVLIVEHDTVLREALAETMTLGGYTCFSAKCGREALMMLDRYSPALVISDDSLDDLNGRQMLMEIQRRKPGTPAILISAQASVERAVDAMRHGAVDYLQKPFSTQVLLEKIKSYIKPKLSNDENSPIAEDAKSQALMSVALRVADADVGVLITGESGTGKEVLAHFIHDHSPRRHHPFIAINCAAIPEQMLEATLFGYEKGAFTGAYKTTSGKFEQAQGGTLLLDEVSEMSLALQAKLLRVLQEKEVEHIGANKLIKLDVRVISTSNRCLQNEIKLGRFREDLFYRLNIFPLHWLPLRERPDDIIPLANYLLNKYCRENFPIIPCLSDEAKCKLLNHSWPGNARELDNVIQRALVLQTQNSIESYHLHLTDDDFDTQEPENSQDHQFITQKTVKEQTEVE